MSALLPALTRIANSVFIAGAVACMSAFAFFLYEYALSGQRRFETPAFAALYYGLPLIGTVLLLAALRLPAVQKINLGMLLVVVAATLYVGEHVLGYVGAWRAAQNATIWPGNMTDLRREQIQEIAGDNHVDWDFRSALDVISDLREAGVDAVPSVHPLAFVVEQPDGRFVSEIMVGGAEFVPLTGISGRPTVLCNETGSYVVYESDEHGFHNPGALWNSGAVDVAAIGDSFAEGMCVRSDRNFVARIRDRYPGTLNLGVSGSGPLVQLAVLKEYVEPLRPPTLLWFHFEENDLHDLSRERKSGLLMRYLEDGFGQDLLGRQTEIDRVIESYVDERIRRELDTREADSEPREQGWNVAALGRALVRPVKLGNLRRSLGLVGGTATAAQPETPLALFRDILSEAREVTGTWGATLYFVYLPSRDRYANGQEYSRDEVLAAARSVGLVTIDIHQAFQDHDDPLSLFPFRRFGHYNEEGHHLVAETVTAVLSRSGASPESR
jgi:hypothetical protein